MELSMSRFNLLDNIVEEEPVEPELASTVVGELTDILEKAEQPEPATDPDGAYWYYSVPLAGVRYYGMPQRSSPEK